MSVRPLVSIAIAAVLTSGIWSISGALRADARQDPTGRDVPKTAPAEKKSAPAAKKSGKAASRPTPTPKTPASSTSGTERSEKSTTARPTPTPSKSTSSTPASIPASGGTAASGERARLILTAPPGSQIEIDGIIKYTVDRTGRLQIDDLTAGRHQIVVIAPDHEPWRGAVTVNAPETGFSVPIRSRESTGRLTIFVNEPGAEIFIDGKSQGTKSVAGQPLTISGLKQGRHEVRAVRAGFEDWNESVTITAGLSRTLNINFRVRLDPEVVLVPGGEFRMGDDDGPKDAKPAHLVTLDTFEIAEREVSNSQYKMFLDDTNRPGPLAPGWRDREIMSGYEERPVVYVSWEDAVLYSRWVSQKSGKNYRLPTEAEWEKAVRTSHNRLTSIGKVWEWCADLYDEDYYKKSERRNPRGPSKGKKIKVQGKDGEGRVIRGGTFKPERLGLNIFVRDAYVATRGRGDIGFRLVRDPN